MEERIKAIYNECWMLVKQGMQKQQVKELLEKYDNQPDIRGLLGWWMTNCKMSKERVDAMYKEAWKIYKSYLLEHDMAEYNVQKDNLLEKYENQEDIVDLLLWWAGRIQGLHDEYRRKNNDRKGFEIPGT